MFISVGVGEGSVDGGLPEEVGELGVLVAAAGGGEAELGRAEVHGRLVVEDLVLDVVGFGDVDDFFGVEDVVGVWAVHAGGAAGVADVEGLGGLLGEREEAVGGFVLLATG